ncbi:hypothetical protein QJQ45_014883 [Haematococcus lacustris]|nr:hypothetical protein QJQ45_014883 [Haematococcus lacustris]
MTSQAWLASRQLEPFPAKEAGAVVGLAILMPVLRWALEACVFKPLGYCLMGRSLQPSKSTRLRLQSRVRKFAESQWKLFCYTTFTALGVAAVLRQPWALDTQQYWDGWPDQPVTAAMRLLYAAELAYYTATTVMLATWEVARKDFHVMMTHHFLTAVSMVFTYKYNYTRVGCVVMLLHDINDVLMETAKSLNYLGLEAGATAVFALFVASWVVLRLLIFPACIIRSTFWEVWQLLGYRPPYHGMLNAMLVALFCIHIYWFGLILRIAYRKLTTGQGRDIREAADSDSEGEAGAHNE